ncbi:MAG: T9SS type A sorting domain-containing protein [Chitinophagaceae bacterium]|nr:T9SS type A sorting domain-containing protein [Chitinophagaceae bacterium]
MRKFTLTVFTLLFISFSLFAQNNFFSDAGANRTIPSVGQRVIIPSQFRNASLDIQSMRSFLFSAPSEQAARANRNQMPVMELPMPDGRTAKFRVWESSIQEPALQARFSEIRTFAGQGIDDPYASIRFDIGPNGFHAQVLTAKGSYYIDPFARGDVNNYISYFRADLNRSDDFLCEVPADPMAMRPENTNAVCLGTDLRTYRLAVACTGEYAQAPGVAAGSDPVRLHNAIVTTVNRVVGVYEQEVAVRMVLVANNNLIEFLNAGTDPFNGNNSAGTLINESQVVIDANIGPANYDIGHTFSTGGGGLAQLRSVCTANKARGITGSPSPTGDAYDIDYVAHEMGHQFGGNHTFNSTTSSCGGGNRNASTAYEVGSGTTIQAYAGICASDNIQPNSDPFFHPVSFDEISDFVVSGSGASCAVITPTGNTLPVIAALLNNNLTIPVSTPFTLSGSATDANGDALTYCWEEWDLGPASTWNGGAASTTSPLFKSRVPKTTGDRTFPDIAVILAGFPANPAATMGGLKGETLPTVARAMKFRLTVRDNRAGGGGVVSSGSGCQSSAIFQVNVAGTTPFAVTAPNGGESWAGGTSQTITWNVAGTDQAPFNVANVRILLSTDGGLTYPTVLAASTPNDGSESLNIPGPATTTARVKVEAIGNIFFDISNANFTITAPVSSFSFNSPAPVTTACPAGATMSVTLGTTSNGGFSNPITLSATAGVPSGTNVTFGTNPVTPGNSSIVTLNNTNTLAAGTYVITITGVATGAPNQTRNLTFTITGTAGPAITTQPSNSTICVTNNTSFSIASATATAFQWQISTDGGATYSNVTNAGVYSGATTNTLTITGATIGLNNNWYRCIASTQCGSSTSNAGILTVNAAPAVTAQPQDITLCAGSNHTFNVTATGGGLGYQWQLSTDGGGTYNNITNGGIYSGATTSSLTLTGLTAGLSGNRYRCVVTGSCPPAVNSNGAILTVVTSVAVTTQPTDATVCEGSNSSFTVAGSGAGIIYQWQVSTDGGTTWTNVANAGVYSGATAATLNITGATFSLNTYRYRCQLSNATCTTPGVSNAGILTVNTLPAVTTNPANSTICLGGNTSFSAAATGTGIGYQWQVSTDGGATYTNITNGGVYAGATTTTLTITGATAAMNTYRYRVVVTGTCAPAANSTGAILTVINPVAITAQPVNSEICSGSNTSFSVTGSSTQTIIYQWQVNPGTGFVNVANAAPYSGATTATLTITGATTAISTYQYRCILSNATCFGANQTTSGAATLTVRQLPTVALAAAPLTALLPGQSTTLTATPSASTGGVLTTSWFFNTNPVANPGNTRTVNVEQVGDYQVRIQETWPSTLVCSNQSAVVAITAQASERLFIFPSPNDGVFQVAYYNSTGAASSRTITIYNAAGAKVHHEKFAVTGSYTLLNLDIKPAAKGLYYVVVGDVSGKRIAKGNVLIQ